MFALKNFFFYMLYFSKKKYNTCNSYQNTLQKIKDLKKEQCNLSIG